MTALEVEGFLKAFFGEGNDLTLPSNWRQSPQFRHILPFVEDLEIGARRPLLLPREHGGTSLLYACAWDAAQARRLAESLRAFIGPTWSDFVGLPVQPRPGDPVEQSLASLGATTVFRLRIDGRRRADAWHAASLLRDVWLAAPERLVEDQVPLGRLLRDFELALAAHDEQFSELVLEAIDRSRELQPANVAFLRIRRLRALGDAEGILRLPGLDDLLSLRLPHAVRDAVLAAGQAVHLDGYKTAGDAAGAVAAAHDQLAFLSRLIDHVRMPSSEAAVDALHALLASEAVHGRRRLVPDEIAGDVTPWQLSLLAEARAAEGPAEPEEQDPTALVQAALTDGRPAEAWASLHRITNQEARLQLAVQCALSLKDPVVTRQVAGDVEACDEMVRRAVLSPPWFGDVWRDHVAGIAAGAGAAPAAQVPDPSSWIEMLSLLLNGTAVDAPALVDDQAAAWLPVGRADREVNTLLVQFDPSGMPFERLTSVLPRLLESITDEEPAPCTAGTCVTLLALNEELTPAAVRALLEALRLAVASAPTDYADLLESVSSVLPRALSLSTADWFLDLVDHLLAAPAASAEARVGFCTQVLTRLHVLSRRLDPSQRLLADLLSRDVGLVLDWAPGEDIATQVDALGAAPTATVLLYSLQTAALSRVKKALERLSAHITVHVSEEHDGSSRLKSQVQNSDVLVLATRRATHAATGFIEKWRRADSVLVYAPGAGSASMLASAWSAITGR